MMKKINIALWLGRLSLSLSITAIVLVMLRITPISYDWMGIAIGILTFITALLIGWQVFNYAIFGKRIKEQNEKSRKELNEVIDEKITVLSCKTTSETLYLLSAQHFFQPKYFEYAFMSLSYLAILDKKEQDLMRNRIDAIIASMKDEMDYIKSPRGYKLTLKTEKKRDWIKTLVKVAPREIEIIQFITNCEEL